MTTTIAPTAPAPQLDAELLGGGRWELADRSPDRFTMIVFYRGLHCPVCKAQLRELDRRIGELDERGVDVIAISGDSEERAQRTREEWKLERLPLGFGIDEGTMRRWGLFVSRGIKETEPALFNEPGLFLIRPDGSIFYEAITSMPWGRPRLDDVIGGIDFVVAEDYPPRGEA
jgi:peroxiredoxin